VTKTILILLVLGLFIIGCTPAEEPPKTSGEVMKVGKLFWPGQYWVEIADKKGFFEEAGLNIELIDTNEDFQDSVKNFADGELDTNLITLYDLISFNSKGAKLVAVINVDNSNGADAIIAQEGIEGVSGLKGKNVGVQKGTFTEYILDTALKKNGLDFDEVNIVEVSAENIEPFVEEKIDGFVSWDPHISNLIKNHDAKRIFDTSDVPGLIPDIMAFHENFLQERPEDVQAFVDVWHRTTKFMNENQEEAFEIIAQHNNVPVEEVIDFSKGVKIQNYRDNKIAFSYATGFESLHGAARQINRFMNDNNITDKRLESVDFIDARFIRGVDE
jgi:NitT/TauT family transport system substrate-binding protein